MALRAKYWVFTNDNEPKQKITVNDRRSAEHLEAILKSQPNHWTVITGSTDIVSANTVAAVTTQTAANTAQAIVAAPTVETPAAKNEVKPTVKAEIKNQPKSEPKPAPKPKSQQERRTQERFKVDLRVILIAKDKSFRSISKDVSLGGMKLKNRVPVEFLKDRCVAYISNLESGENIEIVCKVIADSLDPCRVQFSEPNSEQLKRLHQWLQREPMKKAV